MTQHTTDRTRDYQSFMRCDAGDGWVPEVVAQVTSWLREKGVDVDLGASGDHDTETGSLSVRLMSDSTAEEFQVTMVERNTGGVWTTELHAHDEPGGSDWVTLSVRSENGAFVRVPRLARYLMKVLPLRDSTLEFTGSHQFFHAADVDRLIQMLEDEARQGLMFVAGTDDASKIPVSAFAQKVGQWAAEVYGLAQVIVLDPDATRELESRVGRRFWAPPWTIRTYQPGVQFVDGMDSRRHRILGTERLGTKSDTAIKHLLGEVARQQAALRPENSSVVRARRRLERYENRRLVEVLTQSPPAVEATPAAKDRIADMTPTPSHGSGANSEGEQQLSIVRQVLGLKSITEEALTSLRERWSQASTRDAVLALQKRVDELQDRAEELEDTNRELFSALEDSQMETEMVRLDLDNKDARIRWLTDRLKGHNDYEVEYLSAPAEFQDSRPSTFAELLQRVQEMDEIEFTGDTSEVERLNQIDTNDAALRTAWDAVLVMRDYVRSRKSGACTQGLDNYISHTPDGYCTFPPGKFAENETSATMKGWGKERIFPVPVDINSIGEAVMKAHFKLARIGLKTPRMYIYDGHPQVQRVYIGYLGPHLTNTQTN